MKMRNFVACLIIAAICCVGVGLAVVYYGALMSAIGISKYILMLIGLGMVAVVSFGKMVEEL